MKIYIAGKVTGIEAQAKIKFKEAKEVLKREFADEIDLIVNPMELPHQHDKSWISYMRECIASLIQCDTIALLPNWKDSEGAQVEFGLAKNLGFRIIYITNI